MILCFSVELKRVKDYYKVSIFGAIIHRCWASSVFHTQITEFTVFISASYVSQLKFIGN